MFKEEKDGVKIAFDMYPGDQVYILITDPFPYEHHGIYVGDNKVIHFRGGIGLFERDVEAVIFEATLNEFAMGKILRKAPTCYNMGTK